MKAVEPVPRFLVGGWGVRSAQPRSWFIQFKCSARSAGMPHRGFTVYPEWAEQKIPRAKKRKSLSDNYMVA